MNPPKIGHILDALVTFCANRRYVILWAVFFYTTAQVGPNRGQIKLCLISTKIEFLGFFDMLNLNMYLDF